MPLTYFLFWVTPASGQASLSQPVSCDLPPVGTWEARYNNPFRDLSGAGLQSLGEVTLLTKTNLDQTAPAQTEPAPAPVGPVLAPVTNNLAITSTSTIETVTLAAATFSAPDDVTHADERQSPAHFEDYLVFTDSLGTRCAEFPSPPEARVSWNNTGPPGWMGWVTGFPVPAPITAPH